MTTAAGFAPAYLETTDAELLSDYARSRSATAFAEIVRRHVGLVYSCARRQVLDATLAEDVTQAVFIVLTRKAASVHARCLTGWLVKTTRLTALDAIKARRRRVAHEYQAAAERTEIVAERQDPTASEIAPLLDDALSKLCETDRTAVVNRFLRGQSFAVVAATLGTSEDAARKRVGRAVEKLRAILMRQGVAPSVAALVVLLAAHQSQAAPAKVAAAVSSSVFPGGVATPTATALAGNILSMMAWTNLQIAATILVVAAVIGVLGATLILPATRPITTPVRPVEPRTVANEPAAAVVPGTITPHERLRVSIDDLMAAGVTAVLRPRVDPQGRINLPYVGRVVVGNLLPADAEKAIVKAYRDERLIQNANVRVQIDEAGNAITIQSTPVAVGDHVRVGVYDLEASGSETTVVATIGDDGKINPPQLGTVKIVGLTEFEAIQAIRRAYRDAQMIQNAVVDVQRISAAEAERSK